MKNTEVFFNPFRLISPKLDAEASRLEELYESPPEEVTCLEEGLLIMVGKLIETAGLLRKALLVPDSSKLDDCRRLAREIHDEEKALTGGLLCRPTETTGDLLRAVLLFPGKLERVGDLMESIINVCAIKGRDGLAFSDKANAELDELFGVFTSLLTNFRDALLTNNVALLGKIGEEAGRIGNMVTEFGLTHETRLIEGLCSPKVSSLFLDVLDSVRNASRHVKDMAESLLKTNASRGAAG
jgi:Na+/phosphate symporter